MEEKTLVWKKRTWMDVFTLYNRLLEYLTHDVKYVYIIRIFLAFAPFCSHTIIQKKKKAFIISISIMI